MPRCVVVVPTYNEAENLPALAEKLLALEPPLDVLFVDDASPDGTGDLADELATRESRVRVLHRVGPRGYARASVEGLDWALAREYERVCTMDSDLSHDPEAIPELLDAVERGADMAIGSRYVPGGELAVDWSPIRRAVSKMGSAYARAMIGAGTRDCTSGFRCYRADMLRELNLDALHSEGYSFLIEVLSLLGRHGAHVVE
ncbi:MAG TPA: polyprenol monophosphomannose synthase, partial [Coriobacteriia bacterium]